MLSTIGSLTENRGVRRTGRKTHRLLQVSQVLADTMGAPVGRLRAFVFAYACLSASWPDKPEGSDVQQWFLTVARNAEQLVDLSA